MEMLEPHTALFVGPTGCGKTEKALSLIETVYKQHFDFIVIISPTVSHNEIYRCRKWFWGDPYVTLIQPEGNLYKCITGLSEFSAGYKTLFLIDDIIADESLDKRRNPLLSLAISGRHRKHSLWILTQSYTAVPKNIRRQLKMLYVWYPKSRNDLTIIHEENDVIESQEELMNAKKTLKEKQHSCLVMRLEHPRSYVVD
jgi:hypothetical protein